ncbi:MAG: methionine adenosyltransferase [Pelagibacteraceae bacterium]|nr:methionine adenosyltransferase [Pelagibacteraceae bacterium]PPR32610.1 MAG: S-adenosylmethionine synthase [Alphaproteobacteria bacterium MarineAlpha6_Bin5]
MKEYTFTSESVSEGHPDKVCDVISDKIVDLFLSKDPESRVAAETMVTTNKVVISGEVNGPDVFKEMPIEDLVKNTIKEIGYDQEGFSWKNVSIENNLHQQSKDISQGVDKKNEQDQGAGDQGIMFGYACSETEELMPAPIYYSHKILESLAKFRHNDEKKLLLPDSKSQVSLDYKDGKPVRASAIVVSTQHDESLTQEDIKEIVRPHVVNSLPEGWMCDEKNFFVNPTGRFVIGGPVGDCGLTGRKIIVDTYGGAAPHGGGAFSGKDPSKVDRSGAYAARYLAKNIVAAKIADKCTIQISYAIGVSKPISIYINTHGDNKIQGSDISDKLSKVLDLSPYGIKKKLLLNRPIYSKTATYGHFGRKPSDNGEFSWEKNDLVESLKKYF